MKCKCCHNINPDDAKFCRCCGVELKPARNFTRLYVIWTVIFLLAGLTGIIAGPICWGSYPNIPAYMAFSVIGLIFLWIALIIDKKRAVKKGSSSKLIYIIMPLAIVGVIASAIYVYRFKYLVYQESIDNWLAEEEKFVDLGLSVKWARCNLGADTETDYGMYAGFRYKYPVNNPNLLFVPQTNSIPSYYLEKEFKSISIIGVLPDSKQWEELIDRCQWEWKTINGVSGYRIIGPSGNEIFLPAAGWFLNGPSNERIGFRSINKTGTYLSSYMSYNDDYNYIEGSVLHISKGGYEFSNYGDEISLTDAYYSVRLIRK